MKNLGNILPFQFATIVAWTGGEKPARPFSKATRLERALVSMRFREQASQFLAFWTPEGEKGAAYTFMETMRQFWRYARYDVHATLATKEGRGAYSENVLYRHQRLRQWVDDTGRKNSYHPRDVPADIVVPTNEEISRAEVYRFTDSRDSCKQAYLSSDGKRVTTWTGETLADITWTGDTFRGNLGNEWTAFRAKAINGLEYYGRHNGRGMHLTMKARKARK